MENFRPHHTLEKLWCEQKPHHCIYEFVSGQYGTKIVLTGIKDESVDDVYERKYTFGIPLKALRRKNEIDLFDYALNTVVVYASQHLKPTQQGDYEVVDPQSAVLGFIQLKW